MTNSPEYVAAMKEWSSCMSAAGFPGMVTPEDAKFLGSTADSLQAEVAIGAADVNCSQLGLWDVLYTFGDAAVRQLGP